MIFSGFVPVAEESFAGEVGSVWPFPLLDPEDCPQDPSKQDLKEKRMMNSKDVTINLQEFKGIVK